jgi:molecular chaperone DnaJ
MSHYELLGLGRKARLADIKRAYRRLARRHHPDLNPGDRRAEERYRQINEAYQVLRDPARRKAYDRDLEARGHEASGRPLVDRGAGPRSGPWDPDAARDAGDPGSISSLISEILHDPGAETARRSAPRRGEDVTRVLGIGFFQALEGLATDMEIDAESACDRCAGSGRVPAVSRRPCPDCAGTGRICRIPGPLRMSSYCRRCEGEGTLGWDGCGRCAGTGVLTRRETLTVRIPAGVDNGSRVRVEGRGRAGRNGGPPGDLYVVTQVEPHPFFRRMGDNIHCTVPITVSEAALGTRIEVPTIDGKARIRIPPGTGTGQKFRLRGRGAPSLRGNGRGDQYVEARLTTPRADNQRARQLLQELGSLDAGEALRRALFG